MRVYRHKKIQLQLFEEWLRAIGREDLMDRDRIAVRSRYHVCDRHFREDQKIKGSRLKSNLKKDAIPVLGNVIQFM